MNFVESVKHGMTHYVDFGGRAGRAEYWWFTLFVFVVNVIAAFLGLLGILASVALLVPTIAVQVRRLHDVGKSGWWLLILVVPLIGVIVIAWWSMLASQPGANAWGETAKPA